MVVDGLRRRTRISNPTNLAQMEVGDDRTVKTTYNKSETSASSDEVLLGNITFPSDMTHKHQLYCTAVSARQRVQQRNFKLCEGVAQARVQVPQSLHCRSTPKLPD